MRTKYLMRIRNVCQKFHQMMKKTSSCKEDAKEVLNTYNKCMSKDESNEKKKSVKVTTTSLRKPVKENVYNNVQNNVIIRYE